MYWDGGEARLAEGNCGVPLVSISFKLRIDVYCIIFRIVLALPLCNFTVINYLVLFCINCY